MDSDLGGERNEHSLSFIKFLLETLKDDIRKSEDHFVNSSEAGSGLTVHAPAVGSVHCFVRVGLEKRV